MKSKKTPAAERPSEFGNESGYPPTRLEREAMRDAEAAAREREAASAASKLKAAMQSLDDTGLQLSAEQEKALLARMGASEQADAHPEDFGGPSYAAQIPEDTRPRLFVALTDLARLNTCVRSGAFGAGYVSDALCRLWESVEIAYRDIGGSESVTVPERGRIVRDLDVPF